jgi:hypothetical protein
VVFPPGLEGQQLFVGFQAAHFGFQADRGAFGQAGFA